MSLIFELNKLVINLEKISYGIEKTKIGYLKTTYDIRRWSEEISNFETALTFSEKLNLVEINGDDIAFSQKGREFLSKMSKRNQETILDPNPEQIDFLKKIFFESNTLQSEFSEIIELFWVDESDKQPKLACILEKDHKFDKIFLLFLEETGIFEYDGRRINCTHNLPQISKIKNKATTLSEEDLEEKLEENKRIGKLGEELAIKEEEKRLKEKENRVDLAFDIKQVSITDVYAGFDLKSYNNSNSSLSKHDRMIEVKSTRNSSPRFYWSSNEVKKAEEYGVNYWIYLWTSVELEKRKLIKIQNPYEKFFIKNKEKPQCTGYFLEKNLIETIIDK